MCVCVYAIPYARIRRGKWREAADLMQALRREGLKPDAHVYSSLMSCYTRGGQWSSALAVLE
jgi:pentatricopeptide repeat protein